MGSIRYEANACFMHFGEFVQNTILSYHKTNILNI